MGEEVQTCTQTKYEICQDQVPRVDFPENARNFQGFRRAEKREREGNIVTEKVPYSGGKKKNKQSGVK